MTERALRGLPQSESSCNKLFERSEFKGLETEGVATGNADRTRPWGGCFDWPVQHFLTFGSILETLGAFGGAWGHPWPPKGSFLATFWR